MASHDELRRARDSKEIQTLIEVLNDEVEASLAAQYLGEIGDPAACEALVGLLASNNPHSRAAAALAVGKIGCKLALHATCRVARDDEIPWVRSCAIEAVGLLAGPEQVLASALADVDWRVRRSSVIALGRIRAAASLEALEQARRREVWPLRRIYTKTIRQIRSDLRLTQ